MKPGLGDALVWSVTACAAIVLGGVFALAAGVALTKLLIFAAAAAFGSAAMAALRHLEDTPSTEQRQHDPLR